MGESKPFVLKVSDHAPLRVVGETIVVLANAKETGSYELFLQSGPEGVGPPPHTHAWDEGYYVLEGQIDVLLGDRTVTLSAGEFVHIPQGTVHNFRMKSARATFLSVNSRTGASSFFADLDHEVGGALDVQRMLAVAARHDVRVPPPPAS
jgi:quercetin dioxygenase-like cupin family protein